MRPKCQAYDRICCHLPQFCAIIIPNTSSNHKNTDSEEKPKEPLGIVTEIAAIIFLVAFTDFFPFISKHGIDLTDMRRHLCGHPLAFFGKQFLYFPDFDRF